MSKTFSHLLTLALALSGPWVPRANTQQPAPDIRQSPASGRVGSSVVNTAESNALQQAPLLLELTERVGTEKVKRGDAVHFRVVEDIVEGSLVIIAKGTAVSAEVERLDKHGGPAKEAALLLRFGTVKTITGEELPLASETGNPSGELQKLIMGGVDWPPGFTGFFGRTIHYAEPGTRQVVHVVLPARLDHARYVAAQPTPEVPAGYATVYFLSPDVWCGAFEIGGTSRKVLLRPGQYSCRVERFSPQESYLDFDVADGGTYYVVADGDSLHLTLGTAAEVLDRWNCCVAGTSASGKGADLTKVDVAMFRKLPPFVCIGQLHCGSTLPTSNSLAGLVASFQHARESSVPGATADSGGNTSTPNNSQTASIVLELTDEVTSRTTKTGDDVHFQVVEDVIDDGLVIIAKGTTIKGKVERVDKRGGWMKGGGLILRIQSVRTVTGEELTVASTLGQKGADKDVKGSLGVSLDPAAGAPFATPIVLPFLPFIKGDDFVMLSGTRYKVEAALPRQADRARLLAAQPSSEKPPGYATVYLLAPALSYAGSSVWCGAVKIGSLSKTVWRPGNYSCRVETFSPQESYADFTFADGGTYYLVLDCKDLCVRPDDVRPSFTTAAAAVDMWNRWIQTHPSGTAQDLTKADAEAFRRLSPFLRVEQ